MPVCSRVAKCGIGLGQAAHSRVGSGDSPDGSAESLSMALGAPTFLPSRDAGGPRSPLECCGLTQLWIQDSSGVGHAIAIPNPERCPATALRT